MKKGDEVTTGVKIGYMEESENTFEKRLHFEVRRPNGVATNPMTYFDGDLPDMTNGSIKKR